jgi:hypothetical protein
MGGHGDSGSCFDLGFGPCSCVARDWHSVPSWWISATAFQDPVTLECFPERLCDYSCSFKSFRATPLMVDSTTHASSFFVAGGSQDVRDQEEDQKQGGGVQYSLHKSPQHTLTVARSAVFVCMSSKQGSRNHKHTRIENYGIAQAQSWVFKPSANQPLVAIGPFVFNADLFRQHWQKIRLESRRLAFALFVRRYVPGLQVFVHESVQEEEVCKSLSNEQAFIQQVRATCKQLFDESLPLRRRVIFQLVKH